MPSFPPPGGPPPGTMPAAVGGAPTAQSIPPPSFGGMMPPGADPSSAYKAVAQSDGTVLLHLMNPDGSLGPAIKIVSVPQPKNGQNAGMPPSAAQIPLPPLVGGH